MAMRSSNGDAFAIAACEAMGVPVKQISSCSIQVEAGLLTTMSIQIVLSDNDIARIMQNVHGSGVDVVASVTGTPDEIKSIADSLTASIKKPLVGGYPLN
jgi:hypothetical protein